MDVTSSKYQNQKAYKRDNIYLVDGKEFEVKELFKRIKEVIQHYFSDDQEISILDIGTAAGELPFYLKHALNQKNVVYAFDNSFKLIEHAKQRFSEEDIHFFVDDALGFNLKQRFDVIVVAGVLTIFDDFQVVVDRVVKHLNHGGIAIFASIFNEHDVDVRLKYKQKGADEWQVGYNLFPLTSVIKHLESLNCQVVVKRHEMPFDLPRQTDPIRSWTMSCGDRRYLTNGLMLLYDIKLVTAKKL